MKNVRKDRYAVIQDVGDGECVISALAKSKKAAEARATILRLSDLIVVVRDLGPTHSMCVGDYIGKVEE